VRRLLVPSGVCAAASPPTRFPVQYSPALPWGTTRFGMGLGGAMALSATHTPEGKSRRNIHRQLLSAVTGYRDEQSVPYDGVENRPRPLVRLGSSQLPAVHRPPIDPVVFRGSYALEEPRRLILRRASHLDAVSGYPCRTWLPSDACCQTTGTPAVRPARSSRTRASSAQPSKRPRRIETELSHDVLNPARVPL
jgi:hypothetical protein